MRPGPCAAQLPLPRLTGQRDAQTMGMIDYLDQRPWLKLVIFLILVSLLIAGGIYLYFVIRENWEKIVFWLAIALLIPFGLWFSAVKVRTQPERTVDSGLWILIALIIAWLWFRQHVAEQEREKAAQDRKSDMIEWNFEHPPR